MYEQGLTLQNWIGLWQKLFNEDTLEAFKNLVYLGYCDKLTKAISKKVMKKSDLTKPSRRNVFNVYLVGSN